MKIPIGAAGLMLALTACGGAAGAGGTVTADANGALPVTIGYTALGAGYSDLYTAQDYGIFAKHGLNVKLNRLNDSSQLVAGLASDSVQIGVGVAADTAAAIMKGADLKYVAMSEPHYNLEMWASPDVKSVAELKGKKVAITSPGSESDFGLTALLEANGLKREDVTAVFVKGVPAEVAALGSGAVSAILTQPPNGTESREKGAHRLAALSNMPFPLGAYTVQSKYLQNNREVVKRFVAAEAEALQYIRGHKDETVKSIQKYSGVKSTELASYAYDFFLDVWAKTPAVDEKVIKQAFDEAAENAKTSPPSDVAKYIDNSLTTS
ncbi:NitT/TauT family transport system substrate-binding protein [Amycolatopsis pretoriensis]|uniref:NitT/TauT family transport system substrate-binding protein n=1 Tax=Amycolatopsis pretoriensis TaxID=218821 RepID=A0A1H5QG80_9PSEU|nr:ABC transporter substrate-binding protein [Amycolatopsis pretoriensis]SEF24854.1 NitT/TauT family transport system substrate-binding protein [Amycolatopsis pretoriensis]